MVAPLAAKLGRRRGAPVRHPYRHGDLILVPSRDMRCGVRPAMPVILIGTLDTKGVEFQSVRALLNQAGVATLVLDAGVQQPPYFPPDVPREQVFAAAGTSLA